MHWLIIVLLGTRERHLERLLQSTLRQIILVTNFPRSLIQITLQVTIAPENEYVNTKVVQANTVGPAYPHIRHLALKMHIAVSKLIISAMQNLPILPALIQTAVLTLMSAAIPLTATLTSVVIAAEDGSNREIINPTAREIEMSRSLHVFAFTSHGDLILTQSEGEFTVKEWEDILASAQGHCCPNTSGDVSMGDGEASGADLGIFTRSVLEAKIASDLYWK